MKKSSMKLLNENDKRRLEVINLFGIIPNVPEELGNDKKHVIFDYWAALYWDKQKKAFQAAWPEDGGDMIPDDVNIFEYRKNLSETGVGGNPHEAYENALLRMNQRRVKRGAEIMQIRAGVIIKNGANFYYTLDAQIMKIK